MIISNNRRQPGKINNNTSLVSYPLHDKNMFLLNQDKQNGENQKESRLREKNKSIQIQRNKQYIEVVLEGRHLKQFKIELNHDLELDQIKFLNISRNKIKIIDSLSLQKLVSLVELQASHNELQKISFPYSKCTTIKTLNLSNNNLENLNLEHLSTLQNLNSANNTLSFITVPSSIRQITLKNNKITSLYFLEHTFNVEYVDLSQNCLYDLKFNFITVSHQNDSQTLINRMMLQQNVVNKRQQNEGNENVVNKQCQQLRYKNLEYMQIRYKNLEYMNCSYNKVQYLDNLVSMANVTYLNLSNNEITLTRSVINQILMLKSIEEIDLRNNPLSNNDQKYDLEDISMMFRSKLCKLDLFNGQTCHREDTQQSNAEPYSRNQQDISAEGFTWMNEEENRKEPIQHSQQQPYKLFLSSTKKLHSNEEQIGPNLMHWNFTLGDCSESQESNETKIHQLSDIAFTQIDHQVLEQTTNMKPTIKDIQTNMKNNEISNNKSKRKKFEGEYYERSRFDLEETKDVKDLLSKCQEKEVKIKVIRQKQTLLIPQHIHFSPYLSALLSMSYIPVRPILHSQASRIRGGRLDEEDDDYVLIERMFSNRGGLVYVKKINRWKMLNHHAVTEAPFIDMGFLQNQLNSQQFKQICNANALLVKNKKDVIASQPNVFSCYHIIVRYYPSMSYGKQYQCAYLIQSCHL